MRSSESDEKITFHLRYRLIPYLLMSSVALFLPLTSARVYESAYNLPFTGINNCLIQATLAITTVLLFIWISAVPVLRLNILLPLSAIFSIAFQLVLAFTVGVEGLFELHLYISVQLSLSILAAVRMAFDSSNPAGRRKQSWSALTLGLAFAPLPTGLLIA